MRRAIAVVVGLVVLGAAPTGAAAAPAGTLRLAQAGTVTTEKTRAQRTKARKRAARRRSLVWRRAAAQRGEAARRLALLERQAGLAAVVEAVVPPAAPGAPEGPATPAAPAPVAAPAIPVDTEPAAPLPRVLSVAAYEFRLVPTRTLLGAGSVQVEFRNAGEDPHDLRIETPAGSPVAAWDELEPGTPGRPTTDVKTVTLPPGDYRLLCTLPGHAGQGMSTQVEVRAG